MTATAIYETDFHAWAMQNAQLLRAGKLTELDAEHIALELEGMRAVGRNAAGGSADFAGIRGAIRGRRSFSIRRLASTK